MNRERELSLRLLSSRRYYALFAGGREKANIYASPERFMQITRIFAHEDRVCVCVCIYFQDVFKLARAILTLYICIYNSDRIFSPHGCLTSSLSERTAWFHDNRGNSLDVEWHFYILCIIIRSVVLCLRHIAGEDLIKPLSKL